MAIMWGRHIIGVVIILVVTYCCYSNSLYGDWAYDDQFAIVNNPDVINPSSSPLLSFSSLSSLLSHDFWGQDISKPDSHKSYRPATTLTFRLNYLLHGLDTYGYHLINVILHCVVSVMVYTLAHSIFGDSFISFLSGLLFGLHPIHTEGVSSIVGRSESLCALFYLSALFSYRQSRIGGQWWTHVLYITFYILATISKETGYTVLALMFLYSFLVVPFIPSASKRRRFDLLTAALLGVSALFYIALRTWLTSTFILYNFRHLENPIAFAPSFLTRLLSFTYLHTQYLSLLILPINLSADYSFNAIPLVESLNDSRNMYSLLAYSSLATFVLMTIYGTSRNQKNASKVLWLLLFGIISFLPASNIFFYVGTMLAERLLYIPSIPFCILVAWASVRTGRALYSLSTKSLMRVFLLGIVVASTSSLCSWYAWRTYVRNFDWKGEKELFMSALDVSPGSAKVWQSVGIIHRRSQNWTQAVAAFSKAQEIEPNYCEIDYWLGVTYLNMGKTDLALSKLHESVTCLYTRVQAVEALNKVYDILISSSPNNTSYVISWGNILETINQTHESASYYIQASIKLNKQGFSNQTVPLLEHAITLLYKDSPEPLSSVSPKDELACTAHMWLGAAYISMNHTKAIENMRCIAGLATLLSPPILSPLSTKSNSILLKCPTIKSHGEQALASLYVSQLQSSGSLDARSRLELAVLLTAAGNTDSALYQYYEAASAISATGDFIGAQQVLSEALENTKKDKELKSYKQMEVLYNNLVTTIHKLKKKGEDESYIL